MIDNKPPVSLNMLKKRYVKKQFEINENNKRIQQENNNLVKHILDIDGKNERIRKNTYYRHPNMNEQYSMNYVHSAQVQNQIHNENREILTRILTARSHYNVQKWEDEYDRKIKAMEFFHESERDYGKSKNPSPTFKPYSSRIKSNEDFDYLKKIQEEKEGEIDYDNLDFSKFPKRPDRPFSAHPGLINKNKKDNKPPLPKKKRPFSANNYSKNIHDKKKNDDMKIINERLEYIIIYNSLLSTSNKRPPTRTSIRNNKNTTTTTKPLKAFEEESKVDNYSLPKLKSNDEDLLASPPSSRSIKEDLLQPPPPSQPISNYHLSPVPNYLSESKTDNPVISPPKSSRSETKIDIPDISPTKSSRSESRNDDDSMHLKTKQYNDYSPINSPAIHKELSRKSIYDEKENESVYYYNIIERRI